MATEMFESFGMNLPVIADLGEFKLLATRNGPAIGTRHSLYMLECAVGIQPSEQSSFDDDDATEDIPWRVRRDAIKKYCKHSWPLVRNRFGFAD